ncbi:MAG: hypothetical protein LBT03_00555 [Holosporales bacterium]|jgi:hypothetical protein|nr:hypothetical protein [Holosporales bacterium]
MGKLIAIFMLIISAILSTISYGMGDQYEYGSSRPISAVVQQSLQVSPHYNAKADLDSFEREHGQLRKGVAAIGNMYDDPNPGRFYKELTQSSCAGTVMFATQLLVGTACSVTRYLNAYYPDQSMYGHILIGSYAGKALTWAIGGWLESRAGRPIVSLLNALNNGENITTLEAVACVTGIDVDDVVRIGRNVEELPRKREFDESKMERLHFLLDSIDKPDHYSKILMAGKAISCIGGWLTGISVIVNKLPQVSFWLNLVSSGIDSFVDNSNNLVRGGEAIQMYAVICEIVFLCRSIIGDSLQMA